jgi:hypothetical protein
MNRSMIGAAKLRSPWPALAVALLAFGSWAWIHKPDLPEPEPEDSRPEAPVVFPYGARARTLLGELEAGERLVDGWAVEQIEGPLPDGRIKILVRRDEVSFAVWLAPAGQSQHLPPVATARWELFYDRPLPPEVSVPSAQQLAVLELLAARVREHEDDADAR